ncbi:MAG: PEP-CTERM sorting domain-containing protein [Verrucomicrobiia bacterium]
MKNFLSFLTALAVFSIATARADTLADWTFETTYALITGSSTALSGLAADSGSGTASGLHASTATWSSPAGNGSPHSFSVNTWTVGDYFQFSVSTLGFQDITLSFDQASSNTGPQNYGLFYSVNGGSYTQFGANYSVLANASPNPVWNTTTYQAVYTFSIDLSSVTALDNAATVVFRLVDMSTTSANGGTVATAGTDRVDNFTVSATPVPEPSTLALGLVGGFSCLVALRRKRQLFC